MVSHRIKDMKNLFHFLKTTLISDNKYIFGIAQRVYIVCTYHKNIWLVIKIIRKRILLKTYLIGQLLITYKTYLVRQLLITYKTYLIGKLFITYKT